MKMVTARNTGLALLGLLALTAYILACTSFSPDDKKVLYPAFSGTNGAIGVAVYDRESRRSEMLFLPMAYEGGGSQSAKPQLLRPQWLGDGRRILVSWPGESDNLNLTVFPWGGSGPVKFFCLGNFKDAGAALVMPLPVAGDRAFITASHGQIVRLDLNTGAVTCHTNPDDKAEFSVYPGLSDKTVFYLEERQEPQHACVFGRLDPETFARTPAVTFTNEPADKTFFTYDYQGKRVAFLEKAPENGLQLVVLEQGKPAFTRRLETKDELQFGNAVFSRSGDVLLAACQRKKEGQSSVSYLLMEIPLGAAPIRETTLLPAVEVDDEGAAFYFQVGLSHDGKTAAASSAYLACNASADFKPADCALFFIDLSDANRKVTKVPIPLPAQRSSPARK